MFNKNVNYMNYVWTTCACHL